ncbi:receptor-type tyrosine-protein phosphatase eta-like [Amia ocellicauda]|uniref:receptor-type tyrosine-protein phosphatase eta-like n=1 Tax=Amia ocellicauda TaxID=2972642 RepID=UPI003463AE5B
MTTSTSTIAGVTTEQRTEGAAVTIIVVTKPERIANLTANNISTTSIVLTWSAPFGNAGGYKVEATGPTFTNFTVNTLSAKVSGLVPGSNYTLSVIAVAADNVTEGAPVTTTVSTKPESVTGLAATSISTTSIFLSWSAPIGNVSSYRVETRGISGYNMTVKTLFANISGLEPGSNYTLQVTAVAADTVTEGAAVAISNFTKPGSVNNLTMIKVTTTSITLSWSAPSGNAGGYRVEVNGMTVKSLGVNTFSTEITGLVPGSNYTLGVIAVAADSITEGATVTVTVLLAATPTPTPTPMPTPTGPCTLTMVPPGVPATARLEVSLVSSSAIDENTITLLEQQINSIVQKFTQTNVTVKWKATRTDLTSF